MRPVRALERLAGPCLAPVLRAASRRGLLPRRGALRLAGLQGPVEVRTDEHGVVHVRARSDADAFFAHGFCHARDRFFQMDMLRRALRGRLAETVGERPLGVRSLPPFGAHNTTTDADRLMRTFDLLGAARRYIARAPEEGRLLLDAYVRGVNATLTLLRRRRPLEHRLLRLPLLRWSPADSILIAKGMALGLSFKWRTAPVFGAIAERLADRPDLLGEILPRSPAAGEDAVGRVVARGLASALSFLPGASAPQGSNAFVVGRGRSASGFPLIASDPHLELSLPPIWYLAAVVGGRYRAVGATLPGLPGVVIGRTPTLAWALTNGMLDDADFWVEDVEGTGTRYRVDGRWRALGIETQEIRRRGRPPEMFRLRRTHRGPLMSDAFPAYAGAPLSIRFAFHEPAADLEAFLVLGRAPDGSSVAEATRGYGAPVQNLLWADVRGRAGYALLGRVPLRPEVGQSHVLPCDGTTSAQDWQGWVPHEDLPAFEIGPGDALVSANDPQVDGSYPYYLSHLYEPPYRAHRLRALLAAAGSGLGIDDLARFQLDSTNEAATWFREQVLLPHVEAVRRTRPTLARAADRLLAWDGREEADAVGPALWHLTYHHLVRRTFGAALGTTLLESWLGLINLVDAPLRRAFTEPDSAWAPPSARGALLQRALDDAMHDLEGRGLPIDVPWGRLHTLRLRHPLGAVPGLGTTFDQGPFPLRGGPYAPASGQYLHPRPARVVTGASYRHVVDLADPERRSRMIVFGGQSGHVGSPYYGNLTERWIANEGLPMRLEDVPATRDLLVLRP